MASLRSILVTGATGKQGGAVIKSLTDSPPASLFKLFALTRNAESSSAKALAAKSNVTIIPGDLNSPEAIFKQTGRVYGVYSVQLPGKEEEVQGKALVDAAVANGCQHFVYASVDRGGLERSDKDPTNVPHFASKFNIEKYLIEKAASSSQGMKWTILRPVAFFDNVGSGVFGKVFGAMWSTMGDLKLQMISTKDCGVCGALAFKDPQEYQNKSLTIAGDYLSFPEAKKIFKDTTGTEMPQTFKILGSAVRMGVKEMNTMFKFMETVGFGADLEGCRKINPELQDFVAWVKDSGKFKTDSI
jgi:uncharacterized protein YbjT (DUF2867 family)